MAKKKTNKQPWSSSLESREALYKGVNPSAGFDPLSIATQTVGYLGGFRTGKGMPEDEARWAAYLGLPYDKTYAPDTKIRFEGDENYPDRQYQGLSKRAKDEVRKKVIPQAKRIKDKYNKEWIQVLDTKPNSEYNYTNIYHDRQNYLGDLGKFGIREVGESGIYEVGDKYDFPALIPIPNRNEGTELMVRDTIWSDRANPKLYRKEIIKRKNKHDIGGFLSNIGSKLDSWNTNLTDKFLDSGIGKGLSSFGIKIGGLGSIANTAATAIGGALAGGRSTAVGNVMQKVGSLASNIPGIGGLIGAGVNLLGGITNGAFGSKLNAENIAAVEGDIKQALNFTSNAGDYDALASNYAGLQGVRGFDQDFIGKDGWVGGSKAKNKFNSLKTQAEEAEEHQLLALTDNAQNIADTNLQLLEANYTAYGGPINMKYTGTMSPFGNQFGDGGSKNSIPTQEEYIAQQIAAKRKAALDKSRNRTEPVLPIINGIPNKNSCIYTATDNYGKKYRVPGNWTFYENPEKYGFAPINVNNAQAGDIIQVLDKGTPYHAMMLDGYDEQGRPLYNYSRGSSGDSSDIVKKSTNFPNTKKLAYTFIGTPADSTQWINEYKEMYNKKAEGGNLFTNGVTQINSGGTHEENPYEGIQVGVDQQGIPNLVEEGEVIFNDYVFSNRLRVPKAVRQKYKLRGTTFADAAKQLQKESEERPNDPISKRGLSASMAMLQQEQETVRMKKESNKYAKGGRVNKCAEGDWLFKPVTPGFVPSKEDILAEMEAMYPISLGESTLPIASKIKGSVTSNKGEEQGSKVAPMKDNWLRKFPIWMSGLSVANDLFGGNEPNYSNANIFDRAIEGTNRPISTRTIGNYLTYKPFDRDFYINKLNEDASATRRAVMNTSGGNRAAALAGILSTDYNYGNQLGDLARKAEEYNLAQRQQVEDFNRATNTTNAEMAMKADLANAEQAMQRARMYGSLAETRDKILAANRAEKSANLTNFIQGLGDLGRERADRDMLRWLTEKGVLKSANGGKINRRKKRGGFTI